MPNAANRPAPRLLSTAAVVAAVTMSVVSHTVSQAYNDYDNVCGWTYSGGYNYLNLPYRNDADYPPYGYYSSMLSSAISSWNGTSSPVVFYSRSSGSHSIGVKSLGGGSLAGVNVLYCNGAGGSRSSTALYINSDAVSNTSGAVFYGTGVASHELGHYLGLGHSWYVDIMGLNDQSFNTPRSDDVCGVNVTYPSSMYSPTCGY